MAVLPAITYLDTDRTAGELKNNFFGPMLNVIEDLLGGDTETEVTIATGEITPDRACHRVDTESDSSSDDLTTINTGNMPEGRFLLIRCVDPARHVVVKHASGGSGQIHLQDAQDWILSDCDKEWLLLRRDGSDWYEVMRSSGPSLGTTDLAANGGSVPEVDRTNVWTAPQTATAMTPAHYERDVRWRVKDNSTAAGRYTLVSPSYLTVNISRSGYLIETAQELDLSNSANWDDTTTTDWTVASNRAGKDFYIYACEPSSGYNPAILLSANSTVPDGYTADTSRKIGGFHCVCADIGTNTYSYDNARSDVSVLDDFFVSHDITNSDVKHWLQDFVAGDIIPFSIWDLKHRPKSRPEGFAYDPGSGMWGSIYLPSWDGTLLQSAYNATVADGGNGWHQYRFQQQSHRQGCQPPEQGEFVSLSLGSPQGVNISGSSDPGTTGGHSATDGNRIVSLIGIEDACGVYRQWGREGGATNDVGSSWASATDSNDLNVGGEHYEAPNRPRFGGNWGDGSRCGSRYSSWNAPALDLGSDRGCRLVALSVASRSR